MAEQTKQSAAERKEEAAKKIAEAIGTLNAQQSEAIANMLNSLINDLPSVSENDKIAVTISKLSGNRINVKLDKGNSPTTSHYEKIVLGVCRKTHIESLLSDKKFDFNAIKKKLYRQLVRKNEDDTLEAAKSRTKETHDIYRYYYNRLQRMRQTYRNSQELNDLQEQYKDIKVFEFAELVGVTLEGRRQRIDGNFSEWVEIAVRTLIGKRSVFCASVAK
jgi:hypothetical protein